MTCNSVGYVCSFCRRSNIGPRQKRSDKVCARNLSVGNGLCETNLQLDADITCYDPGAIIPPGNTVETSRRRAAGSGRTRPESANANLGGCAPAVRSWRHSLPVHCCCGGGQSIIVRYDYVTQKFTQHPDRGGSDLRPRRIIITLNGKYVTRSQV